MLNIIACDDNNEFLKLLEQMLAANLDIPYSLKLTSRIEVMEEAMKQNPQNYDVILMDIKMYENNGVDLAAKMLEWYQHIKVIFITGYIGQYYEAIFLQMRPYGVFSKPVDWQMLCTLLKKIDVQEDRRHHYLMIKIHSGVMNLDLSRVLYIESIKRTVLIHLQEDAIPSYVSLTKLFQQLPPNFLYCHKSFIVNMDYIQTFTAGEIILTNKAAVKISKSRAAQAREQYFMYIGMRV